MFCISISTEAEEEASSSRFLGNKLALFFKANPHTLQGGKYLPDGKERGGLVTAVPKTGALARDPG